MKALESKSINDRNVLEVIEEFLETKWGVECLWPALIEKGAPFPHIISLREEMLFAVQFFCLHPQYKEPQQMESRQPSATIQIGPQMWI